MEVEKTTVGRNEDDDRIVVNVIQDLTVMISRVNASVGIRGMRNSSFVGLARTTNQSVSARERTRVSASLSPPTISIDCSGGMCPVLTVSRVRQGSKEMRLQGKHPGTPIKPDPTR